MVQSRKSIAPDTKKATEFPWLFYVIYFAET